MIISRLQGGLGNQLFQYAAGRLLAVQHQTDLCLDTSLLDAPAPMTTPRRLELDPFGLEFRRLTAQEVRTYNLEARPGILGHLRRKLGSRGIPRYVEPSYCYDERLKSLPHPVAIEGYWQSFRYLESQENTLRSALRERFKASAQALSILAEISASLSVSLHVRRGDYITNENAAQLHGACSPHYYEQAIKAMRSRFGEPVFFLFSDDPEWLTRNLPLPGRTVLVSSIAGISLHDELFLMAHCKHHIIANSSFSWWGAWLNPAPGKQVIAPAEWFKNDKLPTRDLIPDSWMRL